MPQIHEEKRTNHNMLLVGLGNTRILTDYAHKSPCTMAWQICVFGRMAWVLGNLS